VLKQWAWMEGWLKKEIPALLADLNKGTSAKDIAALEKAVGKPLPDSFKSFYMVHDGQKGACFTGPFFGLNFLPLKEVLRTWKERQEIFEEVDEELNEAISSYPPGKIKEVASDPGWVPFSDDSGGNFLGIDLAPGPKGTLGQVISFGRDEDKMFVLGDSMESFFGWLIGQLKAGNYRIDVEKDGGKSFNTKTPATKHFLNSLPALFKNKK
jgi:cell wall assembly regulator SMI1